MHGRVDQIERHLESIGEGLVIVELRDFNGGELTREDVQFVHLALLEAHVAEALTKAQVGIATSLDVLGQFVPDKVRGEGLAVEPEPEPPGGTGSVVGDRYMVPLAGGKRFPGGHADGISGIEVNEGDTEFSIEEEEFVAAASGVGPGLGPPPDHGALVLFRSVDPDPDGEGLGAAKSSCALYVDSVVSGELEALSADALDGLVVATRLGGFVLARPVGQVAALAVIKGDVGLQARPLKFPGTVLEPLREGSPGLPGLTGHSIPGGFDSSVFLSDLLVLRFGGKKERGSGNGGGEVGIQPRFVDVGEEGTQAVVVLHRDRIIFVIVTTGALQGEAQKGCPEGVEAVGNILDAELLRHAAAFHFLRMKAVEGGCLDLILGCVGEKVACQLLGDELVVGHVFPEGIDHPVAPGPDETIAIDLVAVSVRIACDIKPLAGHAFCIGLGGEEAGDYLLESVLALVGKEGVKFRQGWGKSRDVESDAAQPPFAGCFRPGPEFGLFEFMPDEGVHRSAAPGEGLRTWIWDRDLCRESLERPVPVVLGTLLDPAIEKLFFRITESEL